jgi:hypothetical protein
VIGDAKVTSSDILAAHDVIDTLVRFEVAQRPNPR